MKCSWTLGIALVLSSALFIPQTVSADELYKREGGQAFHVRRDCPALNGYPVQKIASAEGLVPCRVCDAQAFSRLQAEQASAAGKKSKDVKPPKTLQEMSGTAYEEDNSSAKPAQNAQVKYPPNWEDSNNRLHVDGQGTFYVNNGQKVYVRDGRSAVNAARAAARRR